MLKSKVSVLHRHVQINIRVFSIFISIDEEKSENCSDRISSLYKLEIVAFYYFRLGSSLLQLVAFRTLFPGTEKLLLTALIFLSN